MVSLCLDTARGKHPNITRNERWQKEAMAPKTGAVDSIRFADETNSAAEAQQVCQLLSVGLGMLPLAGNLPPETSKMISAITPLLGKFSIVVGKMDFYQSSAEYSTFDGKQWRTRKVQNYKTPQPKSPGEEEAKGAQAENKPAGKAETKKAKPEKHDQEKAGKTDQKDKAEPKPGKSRGS